MLYAADPQAAALGESVIGLACAGFVLLFVFLFCLGVLVRLGRIVDRLEEIEENTRHLRRLNQPPSAEPQSAKRRAEPNPPAENPLPSWMDGGIDLDARPKPKTDRR